MLCVKVSQSKLTRYKGDLLLNDAHQNGSFLATVIPAVVRVMIPQLDLSNQLLSLHHQHFLYLLLTRMSLAKVLASKSRIFLCDLQVSGQPAPVTCPQCMNDLF